MRLAFGPPLEPMLAKADSKALEPSALVEGEWIFEPKWDGFRTIIFRDGEELYIQSRELKPLDRYFPELAAPLRASLPPRCVVDGEIVIAGPNGLEFETLQLRIHPAKSRVLLLSQQTPASVVVWDLLALGDEDLRGVPFFERRARLEQVMAGAASPVHVTPATRDRAVALDWFTRFEGAGFDGVIAKPVNGAYEPGKRAMLKIKHSRTADCVVAGFRWHKEGPGTMVGSLLLGLYDHAGVLHHVGIASSFTRERRRELALELEPLRAGALDGHPWRSWSEHPDGSQRMPGGQSRWSAGKDLSWEPLRVERVAEVTYDHMQGDRFRHAAQFLRWRVDKSPAECRYDQLEVTAPEELRKIFTT